MKSIKQLLIIFILTGLFVTTVEGRNPEDTKTGTKTEKPTSTTKVGEAKADSQNNLQQEVSSPKESNPKPATADGSESNSKKVVVSNDSIFDSYEFHFWFFVALGILVLIILIIVSIMVDMVSSLKTRINELEDQLPRDKESQTTAINNKLSKVLSELGVVIETLNKKAKEQNVEFVIPKPTVNRKEREEIPQPVKDKNFSLFFKSPESNGTFNPALSSSVRAENSLYELRKKNDSEFSLHLLDNRAAQEKAIGSLQYSIMPACDYIESPRSSKDRISEEVPGLVIAEGDEYVIKRKIKIRFTK